MGIVCLFLGIYRCCNIFLYIYLHIDAYKKVRVCMAFKGTCCYVWVGMVMQMY